MRFFIALELPETSKQQLQSVQQALKQTIPTVNLADPDKLHLTLAFISDEPEERVDQFISVIKHAVSGIHPFEVTPAYIDGFPTLHHAHTFWVGVKGDIDKLMVIRERIKDGLDNLSLPVDERRYTPHIAIAKIESFEITDSAEARLQATMMGEFDPIRISSIKLFQSIPEGGLHRHNTLAQVPLEG